MMDWNFEPSQVLNGKVSYPLENFLREFKEEVKAKLLKNHFEKVPEEGDLRNDFDRAVRDVFDFECQICFMAAVRKTRLKDLLDRSREQEKEIIKSTILENKDNIEMLRAIALHSFRKEIKKGLTKNQALKKIDDRHKELILKFII